MKRWQAKPHAQLRQFALLLYVDNFIDRTKKQKICRVVDDGHVLSFTTVDRHHPYHLRSLGDILNCNNQSIEADGWITVMFKQPVKFNINADGCGQIKATID